MCQNAAATLGNIERERGETGGNGGKVGKGTQTRAAMSNEGCPSPRSPSAHLLVPSPVTTRRNRTASTSERALCNPQDGGVIKSFCRERGHGFITPNNGSDDLFVHISDIEGEFVPLPGDEVSYRLCPIPPKFEKCQAVAVHIIHLTPEKHLKWDQPI